MGAVDFTTTARGSSAEAAFSAAVSEARHEHGHGGYTGTVAEKPGFYMVRQQEDETPYACIERLIDDNDKWGPAACLHIDGTLYLFFGLASE